MIVYEYTGPTTGWENKLDHYYSNTADFQKTHWGTLVTLTVPDFGIIKADSRMVAKLHDWD